MAINHHNEVEGLAETFYWGHKYNRRTNVHVEAVFTNSLLLNLHAKVCI